MTADAHGPSPKGLLCNALPAMRFGDLLEWAAELSNSIREVVLFTNHSRAPMKMCSRLLLCGIFFIFFNTAHALRFNFQSFNDSSLTLLGDAHVRNGLLGLTRKSRVPSSIAGSAVYKKPVRFFHKHTAASAASFSTKFTFVIGSVTPWSPGAGFSFFLSPYNDILGSPGGFLGLMYSSSQKNRFVAVEFDTVQDGQFHDPDDNHVGLDIDSIVSVKTTPSAMLGGINLKSRFPITAWIDYQSREKKLELFLSYDTLKPATPVLGVDIDLSPYLQEFMFVGFSASTEESTEVHIIKDWSFQTSEERAEERAKEICLC